MFADPQAVTVGTALTLPRVGSGIYTGLFSTADSNVQLSVAHQAGKRWRRTVRLNHSKVAVDPLIAAQNLRYSMSVYLVADVPVVGYSSAQQLEVVSALTAWLTTGTNANSIKLLAGES